MNPMHEELWHALREHSRRVRIHLQLLGVSSSQARQLELALLDGRWYRSLTPAQTRALTRRIRAFQSAAEVQAFLDSLGNVPPEQAADSPSPLLWSANAAHLQSLYRPWRPQDGYPEAAIRAAEKALGLRVPEPLRSFYRYWGTRETLVAGYNYLLGPYEIFLRSEVLVFGQENQAVTYWGVRTRDVGQANPPVYWAYRDDTPQDWLWQPSHPHLSDFLDTLTYFHAFGGANHGGLWRGVPNQAVLEKQWQRIEIPTVEMVFAPDYGKPGWPIYIREGQALDWGSTGGVVARTAEDLDEISQSLGITWQTRW